MKILVAVKRVIDHAIRIRVKPGQPFVYYIGSAWDQGLDFKNREAWEAYVTREKLSFKAATP